MKGFRFRLARVLRVRRLEEKVARAEVLAREAAFDEAQTLHGARRRELDEMERALAGMLDRSPDAATVLHAHGALDGMGHACVRLRERSRTLGAQADAAREPWQTARTEVRGMEALEKKQRADFRNEQERRAGLELDEVARQRAAGNRFTKQSGSATP